MAAEPSKDPFRDTTTSTLPPEMKGDQVASPLPEAVAREELEEVRPQPENIRRKKPSRFDQRFEDPLDPWSPFDLISADRIAKKGPRKRDLPGDHAVFDQMDDLDKRSSYVRQNANEVVESVDLSNREHGASASELTPNTFKLDKDPFQDLSAYELLGVRILNLNKPARKMNGAVWTNQVMKSLEKTGEIYCTAIKISEDPSNTVDINEYSADEERNPSDDDSDTNNIIESPKAASAAEELRRNTPCFPDATEMTYQGRNTGEPLTNNDTSMPSTSSQGVVAGPDKINAGTTGEAFSDQSIYAFFPAVRYMKDVNPSLDINGPDVVGPLVESVDQRGLDKPFEEAQEIIRNNPSYQHEDDPFDVASFYVTEWATSKNRKPPGSINTDTIQTSSLGIISDSEEAANNNNSAINADQGPSGIDPTLQSKIPENEALDSGIPENEAPFSQIPENRPSVILDKNAPEVPDLRRTQETSEVAKRGRKRKAPTRRSLRVQLKRLAEEGLRKDKGVTRSMRVKCITQRDQARAEEAATAAKKVAKAAKDAAKVVNTGMKRKTPPRKKKKSNPKRELQVEAGNKHKKKGHLRNH